MNKVYAIARAEFVQAVFSKAFLIGIFVMPLLMGGSLLFQKLMGDRVDLTPRRCAVVDPTGALWPVLEQAVSARNEGDLVIKLTSRRMAACMFFLSSLSHRLAMERKAPWPPPTP
ncbi:MAG: hypothetical protein AAGG01_21915, partial [Planctomycetota bacterium]